MNYYVARNGQTYGPYNEETIRKYLAEGSMLATDMARTETMSNWIPLGQLLLAPVAPGAPPPPVAGGNPPPNLHWGLLLVIAIFFGVFLTIWGFIQANWVKSIDPASKAIRDLAIGIGLPIVGIVLCLMMFAASGIAGQLDNPSFAVVSSMASGIGVFILLALGGLIFHLKAFFGMRDSIERHYNTVEPINLHLSAIMTFFFNVIYFQYHFTRINEWKRTGVLPR
jgi:hypothetical protein